MTSKFKDIIDYQYGIKQKRDIWKDSDYLNISKLENDDVGKVGEIFVSELCKDSFIPSDINGLKTKINGGGYGDGTIYNHTVEIKTARLGSNCQSFQHELGEEPWKAEYILFIDIAPDKVYITLFPNFTQDFYKKSAIKKLKCEPYFPTKSITWRKLKGSFKLDTSIKINEINKNTFIYKNDDSTNFKKFLDQIIQPETIL